MSIKVKRRCTYGAILMFNLCTGLGYAIIFPTIWNYIHDRLKGPAWMFGVIISSYSFSSLFANPLVGWWADRSLNTRSILLVTVMAELVGSILYFVGKYTWLLVIGRLISGIGAGGGAAVLADITRTTSEEERTSVLSVVIASRQLGLIVGPAFNLFLSQADFYFFSLPVDKYTSPGLFMAFLWLLLEIVIFFAYHNLTSLQEDEDVEKLFQNYNSIITGSIPYSDLDNMSSLDVAFTNSYPPYSNTAISAYDIGDAPNVAYSNSQPNLHVEWLAENMETLSPLKREEIESISCQPIAEPSSSIQKSRIRNVRRYYGSISDRMIESAENMILSGSGSYQRCTESDSRIRRDTANSRMSSADHSTPYSEPASFEDEKTGLLAYIKQNYFRDEIVVLLGLSFVSCFAQTVLETVVTPMAEKYYNFTEMDNSYIYLFAGIEVILVYTVIKYASRRVTDRTMIIFGLFALSVAMVSLIIFIPSVTPESSKTLIYFIATIVVDLIGISVIVVCSASLLSKLTSEDSQAIFHGLRRSMCSLGCIMGPLWGGAFLFSTYFLFAVPLAVTTLITLLFILSYNKLHVDRI